MITKRIPNVKYLFLFTLLLICGSVFALPNSALAYSVDARTGTHVEAHLDGSNNLYVDPSDISGSATQHVLIVGCGVDGNCNDGTFTTFSPPPINSTLNGTSPFWSDIGTTSPNVSINGSALYSDIMSFNSSYCSAGVCHAAILSDSPWDGGLPLFHLKANQSYILFDVDSSGNVRIDNTGAVPGGCLSGQTRLCGFTPEDGTTITGPNVNFTLDAYVNQTDLNDLSDIVIKLHNIDQNVLLLGVFSQSDKVLLDEPISVAGHFTFATTTVLADGNYRIEASIRRKFFFDWLTVPFDKVNQTLSKQFVVGSASFIGNLTQNGFSILNGRLASTTATSSIALVANCNPLGTFDMTNCLAGLFVPDANQVQTTITSARDGILTRMPWGYLTRFSAIISNTATTSLPSFTTEVALNNAGDTTTLTFDPADMFSGGAALAASVASPYDGGVTFISVFKPIIQLTVAIVVLLTIIADITGSHSHSQMPDVADTKRRRV